MVEHCPFCGDELEEETPLSAMGEPMHGRGVEVYRCDNPRCPRYGR